MSASDSYPRESAPAMIFPSGEGVITALPSRPQRGLSLSGGSTLAGETSSIPEAEGPTWPREWRAWTSLVGCFFLMFNSWGLVNAYGTFASYYEELLMPEKDLYLMNLIGSTESFVVLVLSFIVGRLLDAGLSNIVLPSGFVLVTLGMFLLSLSGGETYNSGDYGHIWLTQGLTTGLGMACFFVASSQIATTWFVKRKSLAIGIVASGASIAGLVYPFMARELIARLGWERALQITASLTSGTSLVSVVFAQPNPKHPLNKGENSKWLSVGRWIDPPAFSHATYNWFCASIAFMFFGFYAVFFNLEEWALSKGLGRTNARGDIDHEIPVFYYLSVMNASSTIGRCLSGWLSDRYGALRVHFCVMFVSSLLLLALWTTVSNVAGAFAFVIIFGAFSGAVIGMPPATIANIIHHTPDTDHSRMGHWTGMMYTIAAPFALTGPVIAGHLISRYNSFLSVQLWSGMCLFFSSMCIAAAMYSMYRERWRSSSLVKVQSFASRLFDTESGAVTAVNSRPETRDVSDNEKDDGKDRSSTGQ
ncbi:uncharacterized protein PV09_05933 [Verruconis gallopava]|uniref:Major facilitator superfamily (MFS) profile domain-containing protein n=1 Tax=Verruconis gallopava TaxID=253628 RepID=A0A0D2A801_9PEZI|nr:uncharacterized protein PV09_05933 [Verruconis gallopava]KIW02883.1 hypothetical protein PV09_05933 [Verruconis gallopava]